MRIEVFEHDPETVAYLNAALEEADPERFLLALGDVARTREGGLAALAEAAPLNREHLCRMVFENGNLELRSDLPSGGQILAVSKVRFSCGSQGSGLLS